MKESVPEVRSPLVFDHHFPVWGDQADRTITAKVEDDAGDVLERLPAKVVGSRLARVCCIPAFATNLALDDLVAFTEEGEITGVVEPSGRWVFRAWSENGWDDKHDELHKLAGNGALMETCTRSLLSIDAENDEVCSYVLKCLEDMEERGVLVYETGKQ